MPGWGESADFNAAGGGDGVYPDGFQTPRRTSNESGENRVASGDAAPRYADWRRFSTRMSRPTGCRLHPPGFFIESSTFEVRRSLRPRKTLSLREDAGPLLTSPHRHTSTAQRERVRYDVGRLGCVAGWTWETVSQHARRALGSNAVAGSDHVSGTAHGVPIDVQLELICCYQTERALRCGARNTFKIDLACC